MSNEDILRRVRGSLARLNVADLEMPSTPGRSDTRAFYQSPDSTLNALGEEAERQYTDSLLMMSKSMSQRIKTMTMDKHQEVANKHFKELCNIEIRTLVVAIKDARNCAEQVPAVQQVIIADILFPRSSGIVETVNWTLGKVKYPCYIKSLMSTAVCLTSIIVGVDGSPDTVESKNKGLAELLIFLLWKAGCLPATEKSQIEPHWKRRITEIINSVPRIPDPEPGHLRNGVLLNFGFEIFSLSLCVEIMNAASKSDSQVRYFLFLCLQ
jgi:hypothetical protein